MYYVKFLIVLVFIGYVLAMTDDEPSDRELSRRERKDRRERGELGRRGERRNRNRDEETDGEGGSSRRGRKGRKGKGGKRKGKKGRKNRKNRQPLLTMEMTTEMPTTTYFEETTENMYDREMEAILKEVQDKFKMVNPGFRGRITEKGMKYASEIGIELMMHELGNLQVPNITQDVGVATVSVTNMEVVEFPRPTSAITPIPGYGVRWSATGISPVIVANYEAVMDLGLWSTTKSGTMKVEVEDMYFHLDFNIGKDEETGLPSTYTSECYAYGDMTITFEGGWSDMLNVGSTVFQFIIREIITSQICDKATSEINEKLNSEIQSTGMRETIMEYFLLDLGLVRYPILQEHYVEAHHQGTVYFIGDQHEPPFEPVEIPEYRNQTDKMMYLYVTDYVINSGLYAGFISGSMRYNVSYDIIPEDVQKVMRTSCDRRAVCFGTAFNELPRMYGDSPIEIDVYALEAPEVQVYNGNQANMTAHGGLDMFVLYNGGREHILSLNVTIDAAMEVVVQGNKVLFMVQDIRPDAVLTKSNVGEMNPQFRFEELLQSATQRFVLPKLQGLGMQGLPLPVSADIRVENPEIVDIEEDRLFVVATDIHISPELIQTLKEQQEALEEAMDTRRRR